MFLSFITLRREISRKKSIRKSGIVLRADFATENTERIEGNQGNLEGKGEWN
jgi:hypothetical protein